MTKDKWISGFMSDCIGGNNSIRNISFSGSCLIAFVCSLADLTQRSLPSTRVL